MSQRTPLYETHVAAGAKIVDFAGWDMPIHYGSQLEEHHVVRRDAGMFDVSHMLAIDLVGPDALPWLRKLLANDCAKLTVPGKALYSCMLQEDGGIIDDLIVYFFSTERYRIVVNAGTADKDLAWSFMREVSSKRVTVGMAINGNGPVRVSSYADKTLAASNPIASIEAAVLAHARGAFPPFPEAARAQSIFLEEVQLGVLGRKTVKAGVADITTRVKPLLPA